MSDRIEVITLNQQNKKGFITKLRTELYSKFDVKCDEDLHENYSNDKSWSLLKMINENRIDTYQLVYINDKFWGASGGVVREYEAGLKTYQAGFRTFTQAQTIHTGLGMKPYITALCVRHHIERAKATDCDKVVLSFNEHNKRLFDLVCKYHHKRALLGVNELMKNFIPSSQPVLFNGVMQWLLEMNLK